MCAVAPSDNERSGVPQTRTLCDSVKFNLIQLNLFQLNTKNSKLLLGILDTGFTPLRSHTSCFEAK